jgi:glycosyltransferase involved in cell wall biosynthesis
MSHKTLPLATVVIPARNERNSLAITIPMIGVCSTRVSEILVVVDSLEDNSLEELSEDLNAYYRVKKIINTNPGVFGAIKSGVLNAENKYIVICVADELLPVLELNKLFGKLDEGFDFVSVTRYARGGKRFGGNPIEKLFSKIGNLFFKLFTLGEVTDATTGMKAFRKEYWDLISPNHSSNGWASSLDMYLNARRNKLKYSEVPIISVDRVLGGKSNYRLRTWLPSYIRVIWRHFYTR